jgi:cell wall assembly regulator SMI1
MSADDVRRSWQRIDAWLAAHAPTLAGRLHPPATPAAIARAETRLGVGLPEELRASLEVHDGQQPGGEVLGEWALLTCAEIAYLGVDNRTLLAGARPPEQAALVEGSGVRPAWWHPGWIPLVANGGGDLLVVDVDPAEGGQVGQIVLFLHDMERRDVVAPSLAAWLDGFADALDADRFEVIDGEALRPRDLED